MTLEPITSLKHPEIAAARTALGQAGTGRATHYLVEGAGMVSQALAAGAPVEQVFLLAEGDRGSKVSRPPLPASSREKGERLASMLQAAQQAGARCGLLARGIFFRLLGTGYETSVDVLATVRMQPLSPQAALYELGADCCVLVGERIQDPRNVGVLIRTADAAGVALAAFSADSADPYARASVRSTTGSIFRVPLTLPSDVPAFLRELKGKGIRVVGTSAHARMPLWQADLSRPCALVLGNESLGLSPATRATCDLMVTIPMQGGASSLNVTVAAGILCYEVNRERK